MLHDVESGHTVKAIKEQIIGAERLVFAGRDLDDGATLGEYGIKKEDTIESMMRAKGGMQAQKPVAAAGWRASSDFESLAPAQGVPVRRSGVRAGIRLPSLTHKDALAKGATTKTYLAAHGIRDLLGSMTKEVARSKPTDPIASMHQQLSLRLRKTRTAAQTAKGGGSLRESTDLLFFDEDALRVCFEKHATGKDAASSPGMSKAGLGAAMRALLMPCSDDELDTLCEEMDLNKDKHIQVDEFLTAVKGSTHLEMLLQTLPITRAVANVLASGNTENPLAGYENMSDFDVDESVAKCVPMLCEIFKRHLQILREAREYGLAATSAQNVGSNKFAFPIKGGTLKDFNDGIVMRVGAPNPKVEDGMENEHVKSADSNQEFTTGNYSITTTPAKEYALAISGGIGVDMEDLANKGQGETRVLRPLSYYGDFDENGKLSRSVETTPEVVVKTNLTRVEILAIIIYTGVYTCLFVRTKQRSGRGWEREFACV